MTLGGQLFVRAHVNFQPIASDNLNPGPGQPALLMPGGWTPRFAVLLPVGHPWARFEWQASVETDHPDGLVGSLHCFNRKSFSVMGLKTISKRSAVSCMNIRLLRGLL
jgi:hypothetical protein